MSYWPYVLIPAVLAVPVMVKIYLKLSTGWCRSNVCLMGKTVIVTGANSGIGYESAEDFAKRGARVILACRNDSKGRSAVEKIKTGTNNQNVFFKKLDLASIVSVRQFADDIQKTEEKIDILLNNAGAGFVGGEQTEDGFLPINATNYFGPFLLTNLLLDFIVRTPNSRIVNLSSISMLRFGPLDKNKLNEFPVGSKWALISTSRLQACNVLFTMELAKKLRGTSTTTYAVHPGFVGSNIFATLGPIPRSFMNIMSSWFGKTPIEGAQTSIYCSVEKGIETLSGQYFENCSLSHKLVKDPELPKRLWEQTAQFVKLDNI